MRLPPARRSARTALAALGVVFALLAGACGGQAPQAGKAGAGGASGQTAAQAARFPVTLTDYAGRRVTIAKEPLRIISFAPSNTEILFALGLGRRVVGVDAYSDYPAQAEKLPKVSAPGPQLAYSVEKVVALKPDLVLTISGTEKVDAQLRELGIPVLVIQPADLGQVLDSIRLIGRATGAVAQADRLAASMERRIRAVEAAARAIPPAKRVRVFYEVWNKPLMTAGPGSFIDDLITRAGGINIAHDAKTAWPEFSEEELLARNPQVILIPSSAAAERAAILGGQRPTWTRLDAVREGRVYVVDENLVSRPGPRIVDGLESLFRLLYPQAARTSQAPAQGAAAGGGDLLRRAA
ncbi:MAG: cobalamin-binding protein [Clostridia bacterium]|nr:cobalamin-binding protein [Clostridia bacterium]